MDRKIVHSNVTVGENGHLYFAGADTVSLAQKYGTPVFLLDDFRVRARVREYKEATKACHTLHSRQAPYHSSRSRRLDTA